MSDLYFLPPELPPLVPAAELVAAADWARDAKLFFGTPPPETLAVEL